MSSSLKAGAVSQKIESTTVKIEPAASKSPIVPKRWNPASTEGKGLANIKIRSNSPHNSPHNSPKNSPRRSPGSRKIPSSPSSKRNAGSGKQGELRIPAAGLKGKGKPRKKKKRASHAHKKPHTIDSELSKPVIIGRYKVLKVLGKGGFGTVYEGFDTETGKTVAIKQVGLHGLGQEERENIRMEMELLKELKHPKIVRYIDCVNQEQHLNIVLEYIESGTLPNILSKIDPPESLIARYTAQILEGLCYLHDQGVVHRDIKGANILSTKEGVIKLADFGVATKLDQNSNDAVGSPYWMAPEIIEMRDQTTACDIWSVGCTVIELLTGKAPYFDLNAMAAMYRIVQDDHPPYPEDCTPLLKDFLKQCFVKNPLERVTAQGLLEHKWLAKATHDMRGSISVSVTSQQRKLDTDSPMDQKDVSEEMNMMLKVMAKFQSESESDVLQAYCDFAGMLNTQANTIRAVLSQRGVMQFIHALEHCGERIVEVILTIIFTIVTPENLEQQLQDEMSDLLDTFVAMGLLDSLVRFAKERYPPRIRMFAAALLRLICFTDSITFCKGGGLRGLVPLISVDLKTPNSRFAYSSLECIEHLLHTDASLPITRSDMCHKLAIFHDIVPILVQFLRQLHQYTKELCPSLPKLHNMDKNRGKYDSLRSKPKRPKPKSTSAARKAHKSPGHNGRRTGHRNVVNQSDAMRSKVIAMRLSMNMTNDSSKDALDRATVLYADIENEDMVIGAAATDSLSKSLEAMMKVARILNTLAKPHNPVTDDIVQKRFLKSANLIECMIMVCISCLDNFVASLLINTLAQLVSSSVVLEKMIKLIAVHKDAPIKSPLMKFLVDLLKKFSGLGSESTSTNWHWTIADILHCIFNLCKDSFQGIGDNDNLQHAAELGLVDHLFSILIWNNRNQSSNKKAYVSRMSTLNAHANNNTVQILGADRKETVDLVRYIFPLIFRIGNSNKSSLRKEFQKQKPTSMYPLLQRYDYRLDVFTILYKWMLDNRGPIETFMCTPKTIRVVLGILGDESTVRTEYLKIIKILESMFRQSIATNHTYAQNKDFARELRSSILEKHARFNSIRIEILKILHLILSQGEKPEELIKSWDVAALLKPLVEEKSAVLVHRLAKALHDQFIVREDIEVKNTSGRKYKKKKIKKCMICETNFSWLAKKHTCKQCNMIVCSTCSPDRLIIPSIDKAKEKRICKNCAVVMKSPTSNPSSNNLGGRNSCGF